MHVVEADSAVVAAKDEDLGAHEGRRVPYPLRRRDAVDGRLRPEERARVHHVEVVERPAAAHASEDHEVAPDQRRGVPRARDRRLPPRLDGRPAQRLDVQGVRVPEGAAVARAEHVQSLARQRGRVARARDGRPAAHRRLGPVHALRVEDVEVGQGAPPVVPAEDVELARLVDLRHGQVAR